MSKLPVKLVSLLTPKRRWAQFSLKGLFVLVAIVAVPCAWLAWTMEHKRREREAVAEIEEFGGMAVFDWQEAWRDNPSGPAWLRKLLGDNVFSNVVRVELRPDKQTYLSKRPPMPASAWDLFEHRLRDGPIALDEELKVVAEFTNQERLSLAWTSIGDAGLARLPTLERLTDLELAYTNVTDAGLVHLQKFSRLQRLGLQGTQITDAGVAHLGQMTSLTSLRLHNTHVTEAGVIELQEALPNCKIDRWPVSSSLP